MCIDDVRMLGAAFSPLSILLFAFEMCSMQDMYGKALISERGADARIALYVLKLPLSVVLPALFAWYGLATAALASLASCVNIAMERKAFKTFMRSKGEWTE